MTGTPRPDAPTRVMRAVLRVGPSGGAHRVALRVAVSLAVPLVMLWALGRLDLSIYATFGTFASLYGRFDRYGDRLRMQLAAGIQIIVTMTIGTALSAAGVDDVVRVIVVAVMAALVTVLAHRARWHPPGALFTVFAGGAAASIPATFATLAEPAIIGGTAVAWTLLVTGVLAAWGTLRRGAAPRSVRPAPPSYRSAWELGATAGIGTLLAGLTGLALLGTHWYWAMVAAVAALGGAHLNARVARGIQRLVGTLVGVVLAAGLLALHLPPLATIAVAVVCQVGAELFVGRNYGITMVFVTPLALSMVELAAPTSPQELLVDRVLDTLIGVVIGTIVAVVWAQLRSRRPAG